MATSLSRNDFDVKILTMLDKNQNLPCIERTNGYEIERLQLTSLEYPRALNFWKYFEFILKCSKIILKYKPHILHCHDFETLPIGMLFARNAKIIYDSHELEVYRSGSSRLRSVIVRRFERFFLKRVNHCISVNEEISQIIGENTIQKLALYLMLTRLSI